MEEHTFIIALPDSDEATYQDFKLAVALRFSTATLVRGEGLWQGVYEPNVTLTVALPGPNTSLRLRRKLLLRHVASLGHHFHQECIYHRDPTGKVDILPTG